MLLLLGQSWLPSTPALLVGLPLVLFIIILIISTPSPTSKPTSQPIYPKSLEKPCQLLTSSLCLLRRLLGLRFRSIVSFLQHSYSKDPQSDQPAIINLVLNLNCSWLRGTAFVLH